MTNIEFSELYFEPQQNIKLFDYQKNMFSEFEKKRFILVRVT